MHMTDEQLKPNFEPFGNIEEITIIYDRATHMSKGTRDTRDAIRDTHHATLPKWP